jgi:hypothetical protein
MAAAVRRHWVSIACLAAAALLAAAAVADHAWKAARMNEAQVGEWFCAHRGTHCGGASSAQIEAHWQQRQWAYEIAVAGLGGFGLVSVAYRFTRARRSARHRLTT